MGDRAGRGRQLGGGKISSVLQRITTHTPPVAHPQLGAIGGLRRRKPSRVFPPPPPVSNNITYTRHPSHTPRHQSWKPLWTMPYTCHPYYSTRPYISHGKPLRYLSTATHLRPNPPLCSPYQQPAPITRPPALCPPKLEVLDLLHTHGHETASGGGVPQELQVLLRRGRLG